MADNLEQLQLRDIDALKTDAIFYQKVTTMDSTPGKTSVKTRRSSRLFSLLPNRKLYPASERRTVTKRSALPRPKSWDDHFGNRYQHYGRNPASNRRKKLPQVVHDKFLLFRDVPDEGKPDKSAYNQPSPVNCDYQLKEEAGRKPSPIRMTGMGLIESRR